MQSTTPLSAVSEFWKSIIYFRVNVNYTSALCPVPLVLPVTDCSMRMNQSKFVYLVSVQIEVCCILQDIVFALTKLRHFVSGITNLIFALHINNILESYFIFHTVLWKYTSLCIKKNAFNCVEPDTVIHSTLKRNNRLSFSFIFGWSCRVEIVLPASRTMKMDTEDIRNVRRSASFFRGPPPRKQDQYYHRTAART